MLERVVFSNEREVYKKKGVTYLPIYYCMFLHKDVTDTEAVILPELETLWVAANNSLG